jgi:hypothetical protein
LKNALKRRTSALKEQTLPVEKCRLLMAKHRQVVAQMQPAHTSILKMCGLRQRNDNACTLPHAKTPSLQLI